MSGSNDRVYLTVKYEERDQVKALGARWDREAKAWYVRAERNSEAFDRWRPNAPVAADRDVREQFAEQLRRAGFAVSGEHPVMDGKIHRVPVAGDTGLEKNGSYRGFLDGRPNGWLQNFKSMEKPQKWQSGQHLSADERAELATVSATNIRSAEEKRQSVAEGNRDPGGCLARDKPRLPDRKAGAWPWAVHRRARHRD